MGVITVEHEFIEKLCSRVYDEKAINYVAERVGCGMGGDCLFI